MNERLVAAAVLWSRLRLTGQLSHGNCTKGQKGASVPLGRGGFRRRRRADRANSNLQVAITDQRLELKFALARFRYDKSGVEFCQLFAIDAVDLRHEAIYARFDRWVFDWAANS